MPWYTLPAISVAFLLGGSIMLLRKRLQAASACGAMAALALLGFLVLPKQYVPNPDPNHTHADFAVWAQGQRFDFAREEYMSKEYVEGEPVSGNNLRKYYHLHDGNGDVVHRHKPGLPIGTFFASLGFGVCDPQPSDGSVCLVYPDGTTHLPHLYVNGQRSSQGLMYVFEDMDQLLLTDAEEGSAALRDQLQALSDDACRYSKTCPWKGAPPTENCIADPTVPCVVE